MTPVPGYDPPSHQRMVGDDQVKREYYDQNEPKRYLTPPNIPLQEQIRELARDVSEVAGLVADCREASAQTGQALMEAESRFGDVSTRLAQLMEQHRAAGGLTGVRSTR